MTGLPIDQVDALSRAKTTDEIGCLLQNLIEALGFAAYSYVHVRPPLGKRIRSFVPAESPNGRVVHEFLATFPDSWIGHGAMATSIRPSMPQPAPRCPLTG